MSGKPALSVGGMMALKRAKSEDNSDESDEMSDNGERGGSGDNGRVMRSKGAAWAAARIIALKATSGE